MRGYFEDLFIFIRIYFEGKSIFRTTICHGYQEMLMRNFLHFQKFIHLNIIIQRIKGKVLIYLHKQTHYFYLMYVNLFIIKLLISRKFCLIIWILSYENKFVNIYVKLNNYDPKYFQHVNQSGKVFTIAFALKK